MRLFIYYYAEGITFIGKTYPGRYTWEKIDLADNDQHDDDEDNDLGDKEDSDEEENDEEDDENDEEEENEDDDDGGENVKAQSVLLSRKSDPGIPDQITHGATRSYPELTWVLFGFPLLFPRAAITW